MNSENVKKWAPLGAAGVLGLAAAGLGWTLVGRSPNAAPAAKPIELANLVVATHALEAGAPLTSADLTIARVDPASLPATAFGRPEDLIQGDDGPRITRTFVAAGQPIMAEHLAPIGTEAGLAALLPQGFRAMNINVDTYTGLKGFLHPDATVDVVATIRGEGSPVVRTVAQNVRVLAVDGKTAGQPVAKVTDNDQLKDEPNINSVTLLVTPEQAGRIELAFANGSPRLVLRAGTDKTLSAFEGLTLAELKGDFDDDRKGPQFDPWASVEASPERPDAVDNGGIAGIDTGRIGDPDRPDVAGAGPTTRPATPEPADKPAEKRRIVEIIRGGLSTKEEVGGSGSAGTKKDDPFD